MTIRGKWVAPEQAKPGLPPTFEVNRVNGQFLKKPVKFEVVEPVVSIDKHFANSNAGEEWVLRGVETGGFVGFSDEVYDDLGQPPSQRLPHGFLTRFCYSKATFIPASEPEVREPASPE